MPDKYHTASRDPTRKFKLPTLFANGIFQITVHKINTETRKKAEILERLTFLKIISTSYNVLNVNKTITAIIFLTLYAPKCVETVSVKCHFCMNSYTLACRLEMKALWHRSEQLLQGKNGKNW